MKLTTKVAFVAAALLSLGVAVLETHENIASRQLFEQAFDRWADARSRSDIDGMRQAIRDECAAMRASMFYDDSLSPCRKVKP
jgi:predicted nuclease with RNAse H fold